MNDQILLPGMPIRIIVSAIWEATDRPCTVRMTVDAPSDQYTTDMIGSDIEGRMTLRELESAMGTLVMQAMDRIEWIRPDVLTPRIDID